MEEKAFRILQVASGMSEIAVATISGDGTVEGTRTYLRENFSNIAEVMDNTIFQKNNIFLIEKSTDVEAFLLGTAGKMTTYIDSFLGAHMMFLEHYVLIDGVGLGALQDSGIIGNRDDFEVSSIETATETYDAIFSKGDEASIKIIFGTDKGEDNSYDDMISIVSGSFSSMTWELLSAIGRSVVVPSYYDRTVMLKKRSGFSILLSYGVKALQKVLDSIENFPKEVQEDLRPLIKKGNGDA